MAGTAKKTAKGRKGAASDGRVGAVVKTAKSGTVMRRGNELTVGASAKTENFEANVAKSKVPSMPPIVEEVLGAGTFSVEKFVEYFDVLVEATGGTKALRTMILALALRGCLLRQKSSEGTADSLIEQCPARQRELERVGTFRATERLPPPAESDVTLEVPRNWRWERLGNLCRFIDYRGKTPTKLNAGVRLITAKNVRMGYVRMDPEEFISDADYADWMTRGLPENGDLLFTTEAPLGNVAVYEFSERIALAQRIIALHPYCDLVSRYLMLAMMSPWFQGLILDKATGMTAAGIKASKLKELALPLPPLAEQERIVARVDQLMALIDELEAKQTRKRELGARFTQASLEALTTAEGPEEFDAAWKRVVENWETVIDRAEKVEQLRRRIVRLGTLGWFHGAMPQSEWLVSTVGEVAESLDHMRKPVRKDLRGDAAGKAKYPYYGANGQVGWIDSFLFDEPLVCVVEDETFTGRIKPFAYRIEGKCWVNNHAHVLRARAGVDTDYLHFALAFYPFDEVVSGTTGRKKLTKAELLRTPIRLPPLSQQESSVLTIRRLLGLCGELEAALARSETRDAKLVEAVVQEMVA